MNVRDKKGSITIFVLVGLLFMTGFLIISFGSNVNKSKTAKEQFNIISSIYSHNDGDANAYERAYTAIRKGTKQIMNDLSVNSSTLELTKTFEGDLSNYRIYGNSVQDTSTYGTPSPTNPVEVVGVGNKKNLLNVGTKENWVRADTGVAVPDTWLFSVEGNNISGKSIYSAMAGVINTQKIKNKNIQYTISCNLTKGDHARFLVRYFDENGNNISANYSNYNSYYKALNYVVTKSASITIPEEVDSFSVGVVFFISETSTDIVTYSNLQVEEGTSATEYIPYDKYIIPVKISGKNLLNIPSNFEWTGTHTMNVSIPAGEYILSYSGSIKGGAEAPMVRFNENNLLIWFDKMEGNSKTITLTKEEKVLYIYTNGYNYAGSQNVTSIVTNIMLSEQGGEYTPYVEPTTTNIYINKPLMKVGDKGDYIDFATGKVIRYVEERTFTGNESVWSRWSASVTDNSMGAYFYNYNELGDYGNSIFEGKIGMSTHFINAEDKLASADDSLVGKMYIASNSNPPYISFKVPYTELETWKGFLDSEYKSGNPLRVYYQLLVPDDTETVELPQIKSFEDYTKIEVLTEVTPSKIEVEYTGYTLE